MMTKFSILGVDYPFKGHETITMVFTPQEKSRDDVTNDWCLIQTHWWWQMLGSPLNKMCMREQVCVC